MDATQTVERIVNAFSVAEQAGIRDRLARNLRWVVGQRLIPRSDGAGRAAIVQILKTHPQMLAGSGDRGLPAQSLLKTMGNGSSEATQHFDAEIEKLVRSGVVDLETALTYATNPQQLQEALANMKSSAAVASR
jgi:twitching motility protein PilT